jgi:hypothetical protein
MRFASEQFCSSNSFPAPDRGGHDIYADGRVTNRSDTFTGHRSHLVFLSQIYANMLRLTEDYAWYSVEDSVEPESGYGRIVGAPVVMHFREPLEQTVFVGTTNPLGSDESACVWLESSFMAADFSGAYGVRFDGDSAKGYLRQHSASACGECAVVP